MDDNFQIGERSDSCTAIKVKDYDCLSQNNTEYWYSDKYDIRGRINKKSNIGKRITDMVNKNKSNEEIVKYVLENIKIKGLQNILDNAIQISFENGKEEKQKEIKEVLGIRSQSISYQNYF